MHTITADRLTAGMTVYRPRDGKRLELLGADSGAREGTRGFFALGPRGAMEALVVADDETVEVAR